MRRETYSVWRTIGTVHDNIPIMDIGFVYEGDFDTSRRVLGDFCQLLLYTRSAYFLSLRSSALRSESNSNSSLRWAYHAGMSSPF